MKFSYNWLKELLPIIPPPKETAALLTMHAFEVGDLRRVQGDWVLDVDILPNRMADASSHQGVARELSAILSVRNRARRSPRLRFPKGQLREDRWLKTADALQIRIEDAKGCPFYSARVVWGVSVHASPTWLTQRLRVLGLEPINNIVDATNYVMLETGQPLHAFDAAKLSGGKKKTIIVRHAKPDERMRTLDGEERELDASTTVIADEKRPLAIAGIKGGRAAAIGPKTREIILEAAIFDPKLIYRAAKKLGIQTDASRRFEAGRSSAGTLAALDRVAALIADIAEGRIAKGALVSGSAKRSVSAITFSPNRAAALLGISMTEHDARRALEALGCAISRTAGRKEWTVFPDTSRTDLLREEDLIEEVGRLAGYHIISRDLPYATLIPATVPPRHEWADRTRDALSAHGLNETMRLSMLDSTLLGSWGFSADHAVELENPQNAEASLLRPAILPRMLAQAEEARRFQESVGLFEIGKVFIRTKTGVLEREACGIIIARSEPLRLSGHVADHSAFYEVKGIVQDVCDRFGLADVVWEPFDGMTIRGLWHPGKTAALLVSGKRIGIVGEVHPRILKTHAALGSVAAAELDVDLLADVASEEHEYRAPSRYPEAVRDLSVLVSEDTLTDTVGQEIARVGKALVRDIELFDYFTGSGMPEGMKSLAFRIVYQASNRTLTSDEVDRLHKRIEDALRAKGFTVR